MTFALPFWQESTKSAEQSSVAVKHTSIEGAN